MIEAVSFGTIIIDGTTYRSDLLLFPDGRVIPSWWRARGHRLALADIESLVASAPEVIVAGCGIYGRMQPETDLPQTLSRDGIQFFAAPNTEALQIYNKQSQSRKTGACFHLTC